MTSFPKIITPNAAVMCGDDIAKNHVPTCFLDIETNGLPETAGFGNFYPPDQTAYYDTSRVIEVGIHITNKAKTIDKSYSSLVVPCGFKIENSDLHGITHEKAIVTGRPIEAILYTIRQALKETPCFRIVCHNKAFDINVLLSEAHRAQDNKFIKVIQSCTQLCTMEMGRKRMNQRKSPKLVELHQHLFKEPVVQNHRALDDVYLCEECYFEMI